MSEEQSLSGLKSVEGLSALLKENGIPVDEFGKGKAKTLDHLFKEIQQGETQLIPSEGKILRRVSFAALTVTHMHDGKALVLKEDRQVFRDGRVRQRKLDWSVSEKLMLDEDPKNAAKRTLHEELGLVGDSTIGKGNISTEEKTSPSYPGLSSEYIRHNFNVEIEDDQFNPDGYYEEQPDKTTYWIWTEA